MQTEDPHRNFIVSTRSATSFRHRPPSLSCGNRGRKPGQMMQIDHLSVSIDTGFAVKESEAVCPASKLCCMRAYSHTTAACASKLLDRPVR